jgi:hypothetical protein
LGYIIIGIYSINAAEEYIKLNDTIIPLREKEHFKILSKISMLDGYHCRIWTQKYFSGIL